MASGLLRDASAKRERKKLGRAADADRDPAVPDLPETPTWEASPDGGNASDSASGNAGDSASQTDSEKAGDLAGGRAGGTAGASRPSSSSRPARRRGRPRGPERVKLSVRIRTDLDDRLSEAVERTQLSPQYIVEEALERYFRTLGIRRK
jgi:hypothetical protein